MSWRSGLVAFFGVLVWLFLGGADMYAAAGRRWPIPVLIHGQEAFERCSCKAPLLSKECDLSKAFLRKARRCPCTQPGGHHVRSG